MTSWCSGTLNFIFARQHLTTTIQIDVDFASLDRFCSILFVFDIVILVASKTFCFFPAGVIVREQIVIAVGIMFRLRCFHLERLFGNE